MALEERDTGTKFVHIFVLGIWLILKKYLSKVLAKLETLSDEGQRQVKSAFPFWTLKKLQPLDPIYINYYLGALLEGESPENHATIQF